MCCTLQEGGLYGDYSAEIGDVSCFLGEGEKAHKGGCRLLTEIGRGLDEHFGERLPFCKWNLVVFSAG